MKNLLKKINVFGLALILVGSVIISTQSAFKPANILAGVYGYDYTNAEWVPADNPDYACNEDLTICKYNFGESSPQPGETPANTEATPITTELGSFELIP